MNINQIQNRTIVRILGIITAFAGLLVVGWLVREQLIWIGTAGFLAVALNPAVSWLSRYMPKKSRGLAIGAVLLVALLIIVFLGITLLPPLFNQTQGLIRNLPHFTAQIRDSHNFIGDAVRKYNLIEQIQGQATTVLKSFSGFSGSILHLIGTIFGSLLATLTIVVLTYFMLIEGPGIIDRLWSYHPTPNKARNKLLIDKMYGSVTGYVIGNVLTSVICATVTWIFMFLIGIPYALPIAMIVGLLDLVPLVGATLGAVLGVLVALSQSVTLGIGTLAYFLIYQQVENNILQPYVYGKTVQISPLAVFVSALFGVGLGGILGALVAVPVGASVAIILREVLASRRLKEAKVTNTTKTDAA